MCNGYGCHYFRRWIITRALRGLVALLVGLSQPHLSRGVIFRRRAARPVPYPRKSVRVGTYKFITRYAAPAPRTPRAAPASARPGPAIAHRI